MGRNSALLLLSVFLFLDSLESQTGFLKRYQIDGYDNTYFTGIKATDTCYWAFGSIWDTTAPYNGGTALYQFDLKGNLIREKNFISKVQFYGFNNDMYISGNMLYTSVLNPYSSSSIVAYDTEADSFQIVATIGSLLPDGDFISINNLHFDTAGNCYLANSVSSTIATNSYTQIQIVKFNKKFEIEWSQLLGYSQIDEIPYSITTDLNGNVYIGGQRIKLNYIEGDDSYSRSVVYKLSNEGKFIKETVADSLSGAIYDFLVDAQSNYVCASEILFPYTKSKPIIYPAIQKLEKEGHIVYRNNFIEAPKKEKFYSNFAKIRKKDENVFALGGIGVFDEDIEPTLAESKAIFIKVDNQGKLIWKRIYSTAFGVEATDLYDFDFTKDNGFIMAGLGAVGGNDSIGWKSMLLKVDSFGCLIPGCQLTDNVKAENTEIKLKIFPNPASKYIDIYNPTNNKLDIVIYDLNGNEITKLYSLPNETSIINIEEYLNGEYLIQAFSKNKFTWSDIFIKN